MGASGVLHGGWAAGACAMYRRGDGTGRGAVLLLIVKLVYEQHPGASLFEGDLPLVPAAHLFGALGGLLGAVLPRARRSRYNPRRFFTAAVLQDKECRSRWCFRARVRNRSACWRLWRRAIRRSAQCFAQASQALGFDLWQLVAEGPAERLNATEFTQPAMLVAGVATWRAWREQGGARPGGGRRSQPGEFTALVCARGACHSRPPCSWCSYRGQIMQQAVPEGAGAMAAILGLDDEEVEAVCARGRAGRGGGGRELQLARPGRDRRPRAPRSSAPCGSPRARRQAHAAAAGQRAGAFTPDARGRAAAGSSAWSRSRYGRRCIAISAPWMPPSTPIRRTSAPPWCGSWPARCAGPQTVRALLAMAPTLIECGPGKVLTGLNRRIERGAQLLCAGGSGLARGSRCRHLGHGRAGAAHA